MNPNSPNQQPMPGGMPPASSGQPGLPYAPQQEARVPAPPPQGSMPMPQQGQAPPMPNTPPPPAPGTGQGAIIGQAVVAGQGAPAKPGPGVQKAVNPNSTQNMLQIAEIRDGIVIMSDGSFRSVVMVKSINFDLMSPQEQEAVEFNYQNFLNSLYFPIQIFIRSQKVDIAPYIEKLDKIRSEHDNMLLALLMDDYIGYISTLAQQTNIMDKKFYIVIPFFPHVDVQKALTQSKNFITGFMDLFSGKEQHVVINEDDLEKAKTELRTRVQTVLSGLLQSNIQGLPLDTQELIELFYDTYNPDTATRQQLKNFNDLTADIITKGSGAAPQPHLDRELT
ncbi:MAG TPA: hypothetical protein VFT16_01915 [Candidatus Saccharimonadales bacterium]|nr:hypothetical protein [Candidatus Saccharimonadales bacterium]